MNSGSMLKPKGATERRILIVSAYVPPYAPFGSIRVPALAQYWLSQGADVRILASQTSLFPVVDPAPLSPDRIAYVGFGSAAEPAPLEAAQKPYKRWIAENMPGLMAKLQFWSMQWRDFTMAPDPYLPWVDKAVDHARIWCADWTPDIIYSSGPPHSGHLVAKQLKKIFQCLWLAEMRDPWSENPYFGFTSLVKWRNHQVERATLRAATALVTLTRFEQQMFQANYSKPVIFVSNGFSRQMAEAISTITPQRDEIIITHAGALYNGRRDPRKLLDALRLLGSDAAYFRVKLIGEPATVKHMVADYPDLRAQIDILPHMPHEAVLRIYGESDVLLLLRWDDPRERGFVAGKLFEYIAARRPILCLGGSHGEAADIIRDNGFGFIAQSTQEAAFALRGFLETKKRLGNVPILPQAPTMAFTREHQFEQLDRFIDSLGAAVQV
jgi:glycosyltransferase involved in cell wall biosynthesis